MNPDMPDDFEIGYSSSRMLPLVALAAAMTLLSASTAFDGFGYSGYCALVGYAGLAFFGVANEFIRRDSMADLSSCRQRKFVALKIAPALERQRFTTKSRLAMMHANGGLHGGAPSQRIAQCA